MSPFSAFRRNALSMARSEAAGVIRSSVSPLSRRPPRGTHANGTHAARGWDGIQARNASVKTCTGSGNRCGGRSPCSEGRARQSRDSWRAPAKPKRSVYHRDTAWRSNSSDKVPTTASVLGSVRFSASALSPALPLADLNPLRQRAFGSKEASLNLFEHWSTLFDRRCRSVRSLFNVRCSTVRRGAAGVAGLDVGLPP
jgi:hypothetical protein